MTKEELIDHLKHLADYVKYSEDAPALREVIKMLTETHDERTETHACDFENLPSAQPERLTDDDFETIRIHLNAYKEKLCNQQRWEEAEEYQRIIDRFMAFASAQPDLSEYSDKLWRNAYERGKREAQTGTIQCKDCKYLDVQGTYGECGKGLLGIVNRDDFCSRAERREE